MFEFEFMRHAFLASGIVAVLSGFVGWFLVLRGQSFAGHALSHIGFAGATGAALAGIPPLAGMAMAAMASGAVLGWEPAGDSRSDPVAETHRDSTIGLVLAASLGLGLLFLQWQHAPGSSATALLFGNILGIDTVTLGLLAAMSAACLAILGVMARPLLFASIDPDMAIMTGAKRRVLSTGFMMVTGLSTAVCSEMTGVLLVFSLLVGPAATMLRLGLSPWRGLLGSAALALVLSWSGLALSWYTDAPVSFWIGMFAALCYGGARTVSGRRA